MGDDQHLLDSSSSLVPLHVNSINAALAQRAQPSAAAPPGAHGAWTAEDIECWHSERRHTPPLQALPGGRPAVYPHVPAAAEAAQVAAAQRRASLRIALPADERALRAVATQNSFVTHTDHAAEAEWSRLDHSHERRRNSSTLRIDRGDAGWSRESGRLSAGMPHRHGARWVGLGLEDDENGRMSMSQPKPDSGAAEKALRQARDEAAEHAAEHAAELLRLRASHSEVQSQLEARCIGPDRMIGCPSCMVAKIT